MSGATCVAAQDPSQGIPAPSRLTTHTYAFGFIWCAHRYLAAPAYNPAAQGAIAKLSYSYQLAHYTAGGVAYSILVFQNNTYYHLTLEDLAIGSAWTGPFARQNLTAADFTKISGESANDHPDFSCNGAPIVFGYVTRNHNNNPSSTDTTRSAIDNWKVSIDEATPCETKESTNTYAAKFICGVQPDSEITHIPDAEAGRYATKINVHNNSGSDIRFRKKIIRVRGGQEPYPPVFKIEETLRPDWAMEVVCADIYRHLNMIPSPPGVPPYIEGFVVLEVFVVVGQGKPAVPPPDPLDVVGVYTYKGDIPATPTAPATGSGVSINVVVYPAKNNRHTLD